MRSNGKVSAFLLSVSGIQAGPQQFGGRAQCFAKRAEEFESFVAETKSDQ